MGRRSPASDRKKQSGAAQGFQGGPYYVPYGAYGGAYPDMGSERPVRPYVATPKWPVKAPERGLRGRLRALWGYGASRREIRDYLQKCPDNRPIDRYRHAKTALFLGGVGCSLCAGALGAPPQLVAEMAFIIVAFGLWCDVGRALGRVLAGHIRRMIAVTLIIWASALQWRTEQLIFGAVTATVSTILFGTAFNLRMLGAEIYTRNSRTKASMAWEQSEVIEDIWLSNGEHECVAIAYDMGAVIKDPVESYVRKACYTDGLRTGLYMWKCATGELKAMTEERNRLQMTAEKQHEMIEIVKPYMDQMAKDETEVEKLRKRMFEETAYSHSLYTQNSHLESQVNELNEKLSTLTAELTDATAERDALRMEVSALQSVNVVDEGPAIDPEPTVNLEQMIVDQLLRINPNTGDYYGIEATAKELAGYGATPWMVRKIKAAHESEIEEGRKSR